jgi:hypothetical protein
MQAIGTRWKVPHGSFGIEFDTMKIARIQCLDHWGMVAEKGSKEEGRAIPDRGAANLISSGRTLLRRMIGVPHSRHQFERLSHMTSAHQ